jgi:general L-amino acid transport system substrate-binding protein
MMKLPVLAAAAVVALFLSARAEAGSALDHVHARHLLTCGTTLAADDYSKAWTHGNLHQMAGDLCHALAVVALGPKGKAKLVGFPDRRKALEAVRAGKIQVLLGDTPDAADAKLYHAAYGPPIFNDGQGFLVAKASGIKTLPDFAGKQICFIAGTAAQAHLIATFQARNIAYLPFPFEEMGEMEAALVTGHCAAITGDRSALAVMRSSFHARIGDFAILDETITDEPLAPVYAQGDAQWAALVDGTVQALTDAERLGVTRANVGAMKQSDDPETAKLARGSAAPAIAIIGNAGELFDHDLGARSPLGLERQASLVP